MAVYTKINQSDLEKHLKNYDIGHLVEYKEILTGIDNSNFFVITNKAKFVLTIFEKRILEKDIPFFLNFTNHLANKKIKCPMPILDNQGSNLSSLANKKSTIVNFLEGKSVEKIEQNHCFEVGKTLSQIHLASTDFIEKRDNDLGIDGWRNLLKKFQHLLKDYDKNIESLIVENLDFLEGKWPRKLTKYACHLDLFPDNVFFDDESFVSGVIDFYFSANDYFAYDFAVVVNSWCFDDDVNFNVKKYQKLLSGYELNKKFSLEEKNFFDIFLLGAAMRFLLTRLHDMFFTPKNSLVKIKNPKEYLEKVKFFRNFNHKNYV